jgi:hypothetical protein
VGTAITENLDAQRKEVLLAADRLDRLVKRAANDLAHDEYWKPYDEPTAWQEGFLNGFGGVCSELAGVLTPAVMAEVVRMMRAEVRSSSYRHALSPHLLAFARGVNAQIEALEGKR